MIRTDATRWTMAPWIQDTKPLLGPGQYHHRADGAAGTPRQLVCFAYTLLTLLRRERYGAQGRRICATAADLSTATAPDQLRGLLWGDVRIDRQETRHRPSIIEALERLRVA